MRNLRRLLWRYDAGLVSREQISLRFDEEISRVIDRYRESMTEAGTDFAPDSREFDFCVSFDHAVNSARAEVVGRDFKAALQGLQHATAAWQELELCNSARREIQRAQESSDTLFKIIGPGVSDSFFTTRETVRRLLVKSRDLFDRGEMRQSRFLASMCLHEAERLLRVNEAGSDEATALRTQIAKLQSLHESLSQVPFTSKGTSIFAALSHIQGLVAESHLVLAKCMLEDLEVAVAPRAGFLAEITRQLGDSGTQSREAVASLLKQCGISPQDSWEAATSHLLEHALIRLEAKVSDIRTTLSARTAELMAVSA